MDEVYKKEFKVVTENTAVQMGSGDLEVLASPALIAFMENTCKEMMAGVVEEGQTSVGTFISMKHSRPTAIGSRVTVEVRVKEISGKKVTFSVLAKEDEQIVAMGEHIRAVVDVNNFMNILTKKPND